jgi:prophage tail gpP-like protein
MSDDALTITAGGQKVSGWTEIEVTLRAEGFPPSFAIGMSSKGPIELAARAGQACEVRIGGDLVITGYIDRDSQSGTATSHAVQLIGRGKTQDLVDCSGEWPSGQQTNVDALQIATTLAKPYGITVAMAEGAVAGTAVPRWLLNFGEAGADIIQRVARNAHLLAYEAPDGRLLLSAVGSTSAASGAVYGQNVQAWSAENAMDGRYSEIVCCRLATDSLQELGGDDFYDTVTDPNVPRHRRLYAVVEGTGADDPYAFTSNKAKWDIARRAGRSVPVHVTLDSWRDSAGTLWAPNTLVPVGVPGNRGGSPLVLSEVTFRRDSESGTTAELTLMPRAAFVPEPIALQPVNTNGLIGPGDQ